ncbi:MAG TPA: hypothetical protein VF219_15470, partial [Vicinamibacterales bacterium]
MKRFTAIVLLLWAVTWAGLAIYGAAANAPAVQGIAGGTAMVVDGSGVTQPVSAASLPLPTGAALDTSLASILAKLSPLATVSKTVLA